MIVIFITWALSAFVVFACVCRIAKLEPDNHYLLWRIMYVMFGAAALDIAFNANNLTAIHWGLPLFIVGGLAINLWLTRHQWEEGAAEITKLKKDFQ